MASKLEAFKNRMARMREKGAEKMGDALTAVEVNAAAFGFGYLRGRMADASGDLLIFGFPVGIAAGVAGIGLGLLDVFGKQSSHAIALGSGALAEHMAVVGMRLGSGQGGFTSPRIAGSRRQNSGLPGHQQTAHPFAGFARQTVANPHVR